jgi:hypothetical protein
MLHAVATADEQPLLDAVAAQLSRGLSQGAGEPWTCAIALAEFAALNPADTTPVIVSLKSCVAAPEPWTDVAARLRAQVERLAQDGRPVFICTVFRRPAADSGDVADAQLHRIRQLNLLAIALSQSLATYVADVDRAAADVGGLRLDADYRLQSAAAIGVAAQTIASALVEYGLDSAAPFAVLDAAKAVIAAREEAPAALSDAAFALARTKLVAVGRGRRRQNAEIVFEPIVDKQAGQVVTMMFKGQISPIEAVSKFINSVRSRGVGETTMLLARALAQVGRGR